MLISKLLCKAYSLDQGLIRRIIRSIIYRLEGGELRSTSFRIIYEKYHGVKIGMYTHGCFAPYQIDRFTTIGRYCSIARTAKVINHNHRIDFKSSHAFFFNPKLKCCKNDLFEYTPLIIGNDVWIGEYAVILANVSEIGDGAVIGAGAIVSKNVPPYAVVVGNPARVVRYRFPKEIIDELLTSKWWEKDIEELKPYIKDFQQPYEKVYLDKTATIGGKDAASEQQKSCASEKYEDTKIE